MARPTPFLSQSDCEVLACADCAARLANGQPVPMYGVGWPLSLRCEHEVLLAILLDADPECPTALHPVQALAALADYAQQQAFAHAGETEDPDAIHELIRDGIEVVRQLQDFAFGATP